jgi:hypothetical protein
MSRIVPNDMALLPRFIAPYIGTLLIAGAWTLTYPILALTLGGLRLDWR